MKDKLVKTGHKKAYYRLRFFGKAFLFASLLVFASALPIALAANSSREAAAKEAVTTSITSEVEHTAEVEVEETPIL